jgi:hypothetical protein
MKIPSTWQQALDTQASAALAQNNAQAEAALFAMHERFADVHERLAVSLATYRAAIGCIFCADRMRRNPLGQCAVRFQRHGDS